VDVGVDSFAGSGDDKPFFANFKDCQLKPRRKQRRPTAIVYFCLGLRQQVLAHIQQLFLFENKAPVDIQILIHIEKSYCPA
jgi:hypothetical protein